MLKPLTVWKILKEVRIPYHITCLLRNLYEGQGAAVRTEHETTDLLKIVKEVWQAVYCHPAYWTYMQRKSYENAELDEL